VDTLDHPVFDADNHYYEAEDAFTRHLDPALGSRCVQWAEINGRKYHVLGGRISHAVTNATFDPISKPGCLYDYFRGKADVVNLLNRLRDSEPIRDAYRHPEARAVTLDEQQLEGCWLFPTLGMVYEELLKDDPGAVCHTFRAFNRWLLDDWLFNFEHRIFTAPYLTLADPRWAVEELEWALDAGAQLVVMRPAAPTTETGRRSPFDRMFDPFWARLNESGVTLVVHASDAGVSTEGYGERSFSANFEGGRRPSLGAFAIEQAIHNYLLSMVLSNHLVKFPNLRVVAVENGAEFLPDLFRKARSSAKKFPGYYPDDPVEIFRRQVWINPFWEDDLGSIVEWMGADRVVFGSDWPHIEGLPEPLDYLVEAKILDAADRRLVMHDNAAFLTAPQPA
jgi:predicted TIM-barrel fold metal-dependent hydrolase